MTPATGRSLVRRLQRESPRPRRAPASLAIRARSGHVLTATQRLFNRFARRVVALERKAENARDRLETLLRRFHERVAPVEEKLARRRLDLARELAAASERLCLKGSQKNTLRSLLLDLCDDAFAIVPPDEDAIRLRDAWSETAYREDERERAAAIKEHLAQRFHARYGFEPDVPEDDDDTPESVMRFRRRLLEQAREIEEATARRAGSARGAEARRHEKHMRKLEEERRRREAAIRATLRELYVSLAKVLHPDTIADPVERRAREHFMKQAVAAYRHGNVAQLLALELRWGNRHPTGLASLGDDALASLIDALKHQADVLERDADRHVFDPRYSPVAPIAGLPERKAFAALDDRVGWLADELADVEHLLAQVKTCPTRNALARLVRDSLRASEYAQYDDD